MWFWTSNRLLPVARAMSESSVNQQHTGKQGKVWVSSDLPAGTPGCNYQWNRTRTGGVNKHWRKSPFPQDTGAKSVLKTETRWIKMINTRMVTRLYSKELQPRLIDISFIIYYTSHSLFYWHLQKSPDKAVALLPFITEYVKFRQSKKYCWVRRRVGLSVHHRATQRTIHTCTHT